MPPKFFLEVWTNWAMVNRFYGRRDIEQYKSIQSVHVDAFPFRVNQGHLLSVCRTVSPHVSAKCFLDNGTRDFKYLFATSLPSLHVRQSIVDSR